MFLFFSMLLLHNTEFNYLTVLFLLLLRDGLEILSVPFNKAVFVCLRTCTGKIAIQTSKSEVETEAPRQNNGIAEFPTKLNFAEGQYLTH